MLHLFGKPGCGPSAWCFRIYIHTESVLVSGTLVFCKQLAKHLPCIWAVMEVEDEIHSLVKGILEKGCWRSAVSQSGRAHYQLEHSP